MASNEETPRRGRGRPPGNRRDEILRAALEVFAESGFNGASLATVAERVGLTQQGLLHYFPSKQQLLVAMLDKRDELDRQPQRFSPEELVNVVQRNAERPGIVQVYTVLSAESVTENHPAREHFAARFADVRQRFAAILREKYGDHLPGGVSADEGATLLVAVMDGLQLQWLHAPDEIDMPDSVAAMLRLMTGDSVLSGE
ncbi:TetR/AcrR family transcriptional regulator [Salinactinospora qingdaonensis]|uniref:TetR/AcrR family transcriptional regulator n=1 Tax=Salinactinospora qingdaonensis TaxID=702744 RepID=A0ABP7GJ34_9ACTN